MRSEHSAGGRGADRRGTDANANPRRSVAVAGACALLLALMLPACDRDPKPDTAAAAPIDPAKTMNPADLEDVTASYRCDQGHRVDIVRDQVARVGLADGRVVKIEAVRNSNPPTYMDNGLIFSQVSDTAAKLDDREGNTVSCTKTETLRPASS